MRSSAFVLLATLISLTAACHGKPAVSMLLVVYAPPDQHDSLVAADPDSSLIERTVRNLPWSDITFVVLKTDEQNWIEGSGSLKPEDGLSARYMLHGEEHVSARAPSSLDELLALLHSYRRGDGRWLQLIAWN
jgi:hypothetical protein